MGIKKEAPSLFCFEPCRQARLTAQCSDGALVFFDLSHIIEIKGVGGLDHQLVGAVFLDVKGISLIVVSQQFVSWMLRYVVLVTEKRSHASELQDTFAAVHDGDFVLCHQLFATLSSDEFKKTAAAKKNLCGCRSNWRLEAKKSPVVPGK